MRIWLDHHRFEASGFSCRPDEEGVLVCLEFKRAYEAKAFATRFAAPENDSVSETVDEMTVANWEVTLSPSGIIG